MAWLTADLPAAFGSQAAGALDLLPGQVRGWWKRRVVGILFNRGASLYLVLELANPADKLVVLLARHKQLITLAREPALSFCEFFRERSYDWLWRACKLGFEVGYMIFKPTNQLQDGLFALCINPVDVTATQHRNPRNSTGKSGKGRRE
jgi:hypothetical protein